MTREQIVARLEQDYARRREDNLRLFEQASLLFCVAKYTLSNL